MTDPLEGTTPGTWHVADEPDETKRYRQVFDGDQHVATVLSEVADFFASAPDLARRLAEAEAENERLKGELKTMTAMWEGLLATANDRNQRVRRAETLIGELTAALESTLNLLHAEHERATVPIFDCVFTSCQTGRSVLRKAQEYRERGA